MRRKALVLVLVGLALTITMLSLHEVRRARRGSLLRFDVMARAARVSSAAPENAPTAGDWYEKTLLSALNRGAKIAGNDTRLVTHLRQRILRRSNPHGHPYPFDSGPKGEHFTQSEEESQLLQDLFSNIIEENF
ncbi:unnamed protein product [Darwinula stevensoni]|uniref:Uncharacterized protein n=1 Tax=Darwinula stevensoni TaxID=69355 RepID=A0A7R9FQB2_9CRUS|nr:unnamed protein product [Darwinula stevensoni]CAG0898855.1 unnamed protein product [Darwinula stevensoni]